MDFEQPAGQPETSAATDSQSLPEIANLSSEVDALSAAEANKQRIFERRSDLIRKLETGTATAEDKQELSLNNQQYLEAVATVEDIRRDRHDS